MPLFCPVPLAAMESDPAAVPNPAASPVARPTMPIVPVLPTLPAVTSGSGGRGGAGSPLQVSTILTVLGSLLGVLVLLVLVQWASRRGVKLWRPSTWRAASNRGERAAPAAPPPWPWPAAVAPPPMQPCWQHLQRGGIQGNPGPTCDAGHYAGY